MIANINKSFILEPMANSASTATLSACTTMFTNLLESCSGNTSIILGTNLISLSNNLNVNGWITGNTFSAITINSSNYYSGGTNLLDIINTNDTFLTGATFQDNSLVLRRNDNVNISLLINNLSGLTVNGSLSVTGNTNISGNTSIAGNIISGGTNLLNIFALAGSDTNTFVTGLTNSNNNIIITRNDGQILSTNISTLTGLTNTGNLNISGNTSVAGNIISGGTNLLNIFALAGSDTNTFVTGGTFNNTIDTITLTRNDNVNISITGITDYYTTGATFNNNILSLSDNSGTTINTLINNLSGLTINGNLLVTGTTNISGNTTFGSNIISGGTNLLNIFKSINSLDIYTTGVTFNNNNILTTTNNTGGTINTLINNLSGLTVNGSLSSNIISATTISATTYYGNGSNITGINFNQLATTAHTHQISDIINLQSSLNNKFDKSGGTVSGDVFINGNVSILGTATTINTATLSVEDNIITLNSNVTGATQTPLLNAGFEVMRGSATTKTFQWDESNKRWSLDDNTIVNGNLTITGTTNISGNTSFGGNIISGGTNLSTIISTRLNGYVTTGTSQTIINKTLTSPTINGGNLSEISNFSLTQSGGYPFYLVEIGNEDFTAPRNLQFDMKDGTRNISLGGNLSLAGSLTTSGLFNVTFTTNATTSVTLPSGGTLSTLAGNETLTNKTITNPVITGLSALTVNGNVVITGTTNISGNTSFGGNIISGGTNLNLLFEPKVAKNKSFVLSNPAAGDKIPIFTVDKGTTITKVIRQTDSGSTTFNLIHGTNFFNGGTNVIGGTGTTATSAATTTTVFTGTPLIPSGSTLSYHSTGSTFTSSIIYLSIFYTD